MRLSHQALRQDVSNLVSSGNISKIKFLFVSEEVVPELVAQRKRAVDEWNAWHVRVAEDIAEEENEVWIDEVIEQFEEVVE
ncbi:hypothetical protein EDB86DRAFT_3087000 [Lactarius hatsudake]|nr:hypothetical protein EDB86DRAFT_3087000 [Lactarius hatsudake]